MSEPQLLTKADIEKLPRWASVAFAARCARRALPLFKKHWPNAPEKYLTVIEKAIRVAEQSAAVAYANAAAADAYAAANVAAAAVDVAAYAAAAANATAYAANAAYDAAATANATYATNAAANAARAGVPVAAIARDFETVLELSQRERWTDKTPVPPSVFGPIEDDAVEQNKHVTPSTGHVVEIELEIPDHWTEQQIRDHVAELTHRAEMVHRAAGGNGLVVEEMRIESEVPAFVPVGSR